MNLFKMNEKTAAFIADYQLFEEDHIQQVQLQHRLELVRAFGIEKGVKVLEIGCGQGDTTAALADAVGKNGFVYAIDRADADYGLPFTLGEATARIKNSPLGERVSFSFGTDLFDIEPKQVDIAVLSHCSWYFKSKKELVEVFNRLREMDVRVCFAEWDILSARPGQEAHANVASLLALYSAFIENEGNIQSLFDRIQIRNILLETGFKIKKETTVEASFLQDGGWEINEARNIRESIQKLPPKIQVIAESLYNKMSENKRQAQSMDSFVIVAE